MGKEEYGIVCVASGKKHIEMLEQLIANIRKYEHDVPILVFSDRNLDFCHDSNTQMKILKNPTGSWWDKYEAISQSPFKKTIYLDSDVYPISPFVKEILKVLDYCDVSLRSGMCFNAVEEKNFPIAISQLNTGVIVINSEIKEEMVRQVFSYQESLNLSRSQNDQIAFRMAMLTLKPKFLELSTDFNTMLGFDTIKEKVSLVHFAGGHHLLSKKHMQSRAKNLIHQPPGTVLYQLLPLHKNKHFYAPYLYFWFYMSDLLQRVKFFLYRHVWARVSRQ